MPPTSRIGWSSSRAPPIPSSTGPSSSTATRRPRPGARCSTSFRAPTVKTFPPADLSRLRREAEVRIEAAAQDREPPAKPIIWVVTDDGGVFVRSYLGARGRWYQRLRKDPQATLHLGRKRLSVRARAVAGAAVNKRVDEAYRRKYGKRWPNETASMLKPNVPRTTLRLRPA